MKRYDDYFIPRYGDTLKNWINTIKCFDEDELLLRSDDKNNNNTGSIQIQFGSCQGEPDCKSPNEVNKYW